jgi:hypothetical protein
MSKVRRVALAAGLVFAVAAAVAIPSSAAPTRGKARSSNDHPHGPSPALRSMLREIDARKVERDTARSPASGRDIRSPRRPIPTAGSAPRATGSTTSSRATRPRRAGA